MIKILLGLNRDIVGFYLNGSAITNVDMSSASAMHYT